MTNPALNEFVSNLNKPVYIVGHSLYSHICQLSINHHGRSLHICIMITFLINFIIDIIFYFSNHLNLERVVFSLKI